MFGNKDENSLIKKNTEEVVSKLFRKLIKHYPYWDISIKEEWNRKYILMDDPVNPISIEACYIDHFNVKKIDRIIKYHAEIRVSREVVEHVEISAPVECGYFVKGVLNAIKKIPIFAATDRFKALETEVKELRELMYAILYAPGSAEFEKAKASFQSRQ
nr:hypothetical protein K-LCC10_0204 [Kaumoebavirus]